MHQVALPHVSGQHRLLWALALMIVPLTGCGTATSNNQAASSETTAPREVPVIEAQRDLWPETLRVQGSLLGDERSIIGAKVAGRVESLAVDLGSFVKKGETLVVLDRRELELQMRQAEAQLQQACAAIGLSPSESELELRRENAPPVRLEQALVDEARAALLRAQQLPNRQAISQTEIERLTAQLKTAEARYQSALNNVGQQIALIGVRRAELALIQQQYEDAVITAPFDGLVESRNVAPGQYVQVGQAVVTLVRTDKLRFTAGVPETRAGNIRPGQTVLIHVAGEPQPVATTITRVSPTVSQVSRALTIEADVPNPNRRWQAGLFAEADIVIDPQATTLSVPAEAVTEFAGIEKVWVVRDGKAFEQPVRTGRRTEDRIEILDGLDPGDLIVSHSSQGYPGEVVAIRDTPTRQAQSAPLTHSAE